MVLFPDIYSGCVVHACIGALYIFQNLLPVDLWIGWHSVDFRYRPASARDAVAIHVRGDLAWGRRGAWGCFNVRATASLSKFQQTDTITGNLRCTTSYFFLSWRTDPYCRHRWQSL